MHGSLARSFRLAPILCLPLLACAVSELPGWVGGGVLDGNRRLGREVVPSRYLLDLRIDPSQGRFSGEATIDAEVTKPIRRIQLHGSDLNVTQVSVEAGGVAAGVALVRGANGLLVLELDRRLEVGPVSLRFSWDAPLLERPLGLYRVEDRGRFYAFTQFEPLEARKAFPCFDQPEFKTPFAVTLRVPPGHQALSGGPVAQKTSGTDEDVFVFAETRPLPTYLVAFAVGELDFLEGGSDPPTRVVAVQGKAGLGRYALGQTPLVLRWLSDYFDHPFPFAKLDLVAVPNFGAGAMENVGLVTFREPYLLFDPQEAPIWSRYASQSIIAHELSHMWYGNLVTMAWWDDLWLNESFATWMAAKVLADIDPELDSGLDTVASAQRTMVLDSKRDARRIRQPIEHGGDVYNAFDGITYGKGAAVLRMVEAWTGEDAFRAGVRAYMRDHAYGSGGTVELLAALEAASGLPVGETMATFLDQPGTPLVQTELVCKEDAAPRLRLRQTRALPAGSEAPEGEPWSVPVCVALGTGDPAAPRARECFRLEEREQELPLTAVDGCPTWVHPNAGERGYYRWDLPPEARVALVRDHGGLLDPAEAAAIPGHYRALLEAEVLPVGDLLEVLRALAVHEKRQVVSAVAEVLFDLFEVGIPDPDSPAGEAFAREVRTLLGRQLDRVGVLPLPGESADARLRRSTLVRTLAVLGRDPWIATRARSVASDFVVDPAAADEEVLGLLLPIAALDGDADLWDALVAIAADPPSPVVRGIVVTSLARFSDPELVRRSLGAVLDGRLRDQDYRTIARGIVPSARPAAWDWLTESYGELVSKLGPMASTALPWLAEGLCTRDDEKRIRAFFDGRSDAPRGTRRNVELVAEDVSRCARLRQAIQVDLAEALGAAS